jgi:hypothetical protein
MRRACAFAMALHALACGGGDGQGAGSTEAHGDAAAGCNGRGETLYPGLVKLSASGYAFEIVELVPAAPTLVQSQPGNTWTVRIRDGEGAALEGAALNVQSFMPDHNHAGPPAVGVEHEPGVYTIENLLLPMPALYAITLLAGEERVVYSICISAQTG